MTNLMVNTSKVASEGLRLLINELMFTKMTNQKYTKTFKAPESIGDTLTIRVPFNPKVRNGKTLSAQDFIEQSRTLTINKQKGVDLKFSSQEKELDIKEFSDRVLQKEIPNLATEVEADNLLDAVNSVPFAVTNSTLVTDDIYKTRARMLENLTPKGQAWKFLVSPNSQVNLLKGTEGLQNSQRQISDQYEDGFIKRLSGFDFYECTVLPRYETGTSTARTGTIASNASEGATTLALAGFTASQTGAFKKGEIFTVGSIKTVNYQTKTTYSTPRQFVVLADADTDGSGNATVSVYPIYAGGGTLAGGQSTDMLKNVSALPQASDAVTFLGNASSSYEQSLAFHPDFFTVAFCDPSVPRGVNEGNKAMHEGIGMRYVEDFDINKDDYLSRWDVYYGNARLWEYFACRVIEV